MKKFAFIALLGSSALFAATGSPQAVSEGYPDVIGQTSEGCALIVGHDNTLQVICKNSDGSHDGHAVIYKDGKYVDVTTGKEVKIPDSVHVTHDAASGKVTVQK